MIKRTCLGLVSLWTFSNVALANSTVQDLMRQKLESAHAILDALALEDFTKIEYHAKLLKEISHATTWYKADSEDFRHHAKSFQNSADYLAEQAKLRSLEGASLGYIRVQLDCIECHKVVRAAKKAK